MRRATGPVLLAIVVLSGCGSGGGKDTTSASSATTAATTAARKTAPATTPADPGEGGARAVVVAFAQRLSEAQDAAACALLTPAAIRRIRSASVSCPRALAIARSQTGDEVLRTLVSRARTSAIAVTGRSAVAQPLTASGGPSRLVYRGGRWRVDVRLR